MARTPSDLGSAALAAGARGAGGCCRWERGILGLDRTSRLQRMALRTRLQSRPLPLRQAATARAHCILRILRPPRRIKTPARAAVDGRASGLRLYHSLMGRGLPSSCLCCAPASPNTLRRTDEQGRIGVSAGALGPVCSSPSSFQTQASLQALKSGWSVATEVAKSASRKETQSRRAASMLRLLEWTVKPAERYVAALRITHLPRHGAALDNSQRRF